ncbi:DxFTY motif-containing membrane protein [Mesoplasma melaleucae]|uniref:Uncharacterized protein n=1 Tax=Mesoplasma melaleucae TaxID=81459 RepID=A0A2K8NVV6_9MOLU|nr:hypothetical protein [Mesoplasma melaleucae]ATZ17962.1 hypothetical protein EMELA_v1c04010 [Mesoplasma melaleucae]
MTNTKKIDWNKTREFDLERTNIWISFSFEILFVVLPYVIIWILIGSTWNTAKYHNFYNDLPLKEFLLTIICIGYILISLGINFITYLLKWQKEDSFTFTIAIGLCLTGFICNSIWIDKLSIGWFAIFLKIIFLVIFALIGIFIGTLGTMLIRNLRFKIEEEDQLLLEAYKNCKKIPLIKRIRLERAEKYKLKKVQEVEELNKFKEELNEKIALELKNKKEDELLNKKSIKLNQKEEKKHQKKNNKK